MVKKYLHIKFLLATNSNELLFYYNLNKSSSEQKKLQKENLLDNITSLIKQQNNYNELTNIINLFETLIIFEGNINTNNYTIKIVNPNTNIIELLNIYNTNRQNTSIHTFFKQTCLYIYDGLLLFLLLLKHRGLNELNFQINKKAILYVGGFQIYYLNNTDLNNYLMYLYNIFAGNTDKFINCIILQKLFTSGGKISSKLIKKSLKTYNNKHKLLSINKNEKSIIENYKNKVFSPFYLN